MNYDVSKAVLGIDNAPMQEKGEPLLFRHVFVNGLLNSPETDRTMDRAEKLKAYRLALRIQGSAEIQLSADAVVLIKDCTNKWYSRLVVGRVEDFFEGENKVS